MGPLIPKTWRTTQFAKFQQNEHIPFWTSGDVSSGFYGVFTWSGTGTEIGTLTGMRQWVKIGLVPCLGSGVM